MDIHDYANLSPDTVLDAVESLGFLSDLRILALNSYENRVFQVGIESGTPIIAKFYRPNRWTNEQIIEEHNFSLALSEMEVPIIPPTVINNNTLFSHNNYRFSLYERKGGHAPELDDLDTLYTLGQHLGRIHALGRVKNFEHRLTIDLNSFVHQPVQFICENEFIPRSLLPAYSAITNQLIEKLDLLYCTNQFSTIRLHGDCHRGNIISRPDSLYLVDLDDARNGPAIQDIWMLLAGDRAQRIGQLSSVLEGYEEFCEFNSRELQLIEPLRTMRIIHYAGWLAKRWQDPAFPAAFPWFNTENFWSNHILELKEQLAELNEPPLTLPN